MLAQAPGIAWEEYKAGGRWGDMREHDVLPADLVMDLALKAIPHLWGVESMGVAALAARLGVPPTRMTVVIRRKPSIFTDAPGRGPGDDAATGRNSRCVSLNPSFYPPLEQRLRQPRRGTETT